MNGRCEEYQSALPDLLSGLLPEAQVDAIMRHVGECPACRAYFEALQDDDELLTGYVAAMRPVIAAVEDVVVRSLGQRMREPAGTAAPSRTMARGTRLRLAVAAVVALAILGVLGRVLGPVRMSTPSLAQTLEAMQARPWVHSVTEMQSSEGVEVHEDWECFAVHIRARKTPDGFVRYTNFAENAAYQYNPHSHKITVAFTTDNYMVPRHKTAFDMVSEIVESVDATTVTITRQPRVGRGQRVELIRLDFTSNPYCESTVLVRDIQQNLLLQMEQNALNGQERYCITTAFDYPDRGPGDIYALGVPPDAVIHDIRPGGPALGLVDEIQARFERGFGDYLAVILESWVGEDGAREPSAIAVLRQQGNLKRCDCYYAFDFGDYPRAPATLYPQVKDEWPNLTIPQVLALETVDALERRLLFDGQKTIRYRREDGELIRDEHPADQFMLPSMSPYVFFLPGLIWPNLHLEIQSGSSQYQREVRLLPEDPNRPNLVGLQLVRFAETENFWFDPDKDYMLMERIKTQQGIGTRTCYAVVQAGQTSSGRWYPSVIHMADHEQRVLVDDNPVFDEPLRVWSAQEQPEETAPEQSTSTVTAPLPAEGMVGSIRDEQSGAIPQATVVLYSNRNHWGLGNRVVEQTQTDPNGRFVLATPLEFDPDNAQDYYILFAVHPDFALAWRNIHEGQEKQMYGLTLTAPVTRVIAVTDHEGNPLAGARVWLYSAGERTSSNPLFQDYFIVPTDVGLIGSLTDADGCAIVANLPATACSFHATLDGYANGLAFSGQNHIRLSPGADVSGWVLTDTGLPVEGAVIRFYTDWGHQYFLAETDERGHFELADLPAQGWDRSPWGRSDGANGGYTLTVEHGDYAAPDRRLRLLPGQRIDDLVIEVATETTLVTCLVIEEGTNKPVAGARIDGSNRIGSFERRSDANGIVSIRLLSGPVTLRFTSPPAGVYVLNDGLASGEDRLEFEAQGSQMNVVLKSPPIGGHLVNVPGVILGPGGLPAANAVVYAAAGRFHTATAGNYVRPTGADADGRFELKDVPAGRPLHLYAETRDHSLAAVNVLDIPADANQATSIGLALQPTAVAVTVIQEQGGGLVRDTALSVCPIVEGEQFGLAARNGRTDQFGILRMEGIVPGLAYHLRDARFDEVTGRMPDGWDKWFKRDIVLIPLEP